MIEFNINNYVHVKLTEAGLTELKRQHEQLSKYIRGGLGDWKPPKTDSDGFSKFQMYNLMNRFGHMLHCASKAPFEMTIRIEEQ